MILSNPDADFNIAAFYKIKCVKNGARQSHSYY